MKSKKKVLAFWGGHHESNVLDLALDYIHKNDNVLLLCCDETEGICVRNYRKCEAYCWICKQSKREVLRKFASDFTNYHFLAEYISEEMIHEADAFEFKYKSTKELKCITYHDVEIGFGAFSTYVTLTRHCNPQYSDTVKQYLNDMMRAEIRLILIAEKIIKEFAPDLIIFHNGRFAQYKPFLGIAKNVGIDYIASELDSNSIGEELHNDFYNDIPHSTTSFDRGIKRDWASADPKEREKIGRQFYENRRNAIRAGDTVYTKDQKLGMLPKDWDTSKYNIVIFNSSEDEFCSISKEYDDGQLFECQFVAIKKILEHYKADTAKHFYLRIHPNLGDVDDISHLALYKLEYPNFSIISPKSPISTYTLIDEANKVVVFNSTVGIEAAYWGKPVISLNMCAYDSMNVSYCPTSEEDVYEYIDKEPLPAKKNIGCLKYAYYLLHVNYPKQRYLKNYWRKRKIFGKTVEYTRIFTLLGSKWLYAFANYMVNRIHLSCRPFAKYKEVPKDRDLWNIELDD